MANSAAAKNPEELEESRGQSPQRLSQRNRHFRFTQISSFADKLLGSWPEQEDAEWRAAWAKSRISPEEERATEGGKNLLTSRSTCLLSR